jgi:hypothetical protein
MVNANYLPKSLSKLVVDRNILNPDGFFYILHKWLQPLSTPDND